MAVHTLQVTLGAGSNTQVSATRKPCKAIIIQNNAAHVCRVGDVNTSSTRGIQLASGSPGGSTTLQHVVAYDSDLSQWYVAGTAADVIDVLWIA